MKTKKSLTVYQNSKKHLDSDRKENYTVSFLGVRHISRDKNLLDTIGITFSKMQNWFSKKRYFCLIFHIKF